MATVKVTDDSFETEVLKASTPVLVDFWAEWCGPCKQIGPALEQIADELGGQVTVAKVNIDDSPMTPSKLGVKGIPTLMLFKDGQMTSMKVGAMPKGKIVEWLAEAGGKAAGKGGGARSRGKTRGAARRRVAPFLSRRLRSAKSPGWRPAPRLRGTASRR